MKNRKISLLLIVMLCFTSINVSAENTDSIKQEIESNKDAIEDLKDEADSINNQIQDENDKLSIIENEILEKNKSLEAVRIKVQEFQVEIDNVQSEIDKFEKEISELQSDIETKNEKIEELKLEQKRLEEIKSVRVRSYYKVDMTKQYLYLILKSENVFEVFQNIDKVLKLMELDRELLKNTEENSLSIKEELENLNLVIETQKEKQNEIVQKKNELVLAQSEFSSAKNEEEAKINELQSLQYEKEYLIASLEEKGEMIQNSIDSLLAYNYELQAKLDGIFEDLNNGGSNNDEVIETLPESNGFLRPVNGPITSEFGERINPVTGEHGFHSGIDYGNDTGTPILASKSGVVVYSGWISGYGNTIILDHGGGIQTLYAHADSLSVDYGQAVAQGEEVAKVGSTGMSTGPHLHFEIRIDGTPVDPFGYIPY